MTAGGCSGVRLLAAWLVLLAGPAAESRPADGDRAALRLRPRVYVDRTSGTAFRFPFTWWVPDLCGDAVVDPRVYRHWRQDPSAQQRAAAEREAAAAAAETGRPHPPRWLPCGVRHFSRPLAELPPGLRTADLEALATWLIDGEVVTCEPVDYAAPAPERPFVEPWEGMPEISALRGVCERGRFLLVAHGERRSGLLVGDLVPARAVENLFASFEIMRPWGKRRTVTWRRYQCAHQLVLDGDDAPVAISRAPRAADYDHGYAWESRHFHITGTAPPAVIRGNARLLDRQHRALRELLPLPCAQRVKFEVILCRTRDEFIDMARRFTWGGKRIDPAKLSMEGFYSDFARAQFSFTERRGRSIGNARRRLAHETVHQYLHLHGGGPRLPRWFDEGMAVLFEDSDADLTRYTVRPSRTRLVYLERWYDQRGGPIQDLDAYAAARSFSNIHQYAEACAMVHQLVVEPEDGRQQLAVCWRRLREGEGFAAAFAATLFAARLAAADGDAERACAAWGRDLVTYVRAERARRPLLVDLVTRE